MSLINFGNSFKMEFLGLSNWKACESKNILSVRESSEVVQANLNDQLYSILTIGLVDASNSAAYNYLIQWLHVELI